MTTYNQDVTCHGGEDASLVVAVPDDLTGCTAVYELHDLAGESVMLGDPAAAVPDAACTVAEAVSGWEVSVTLPKALTSALPCGMYRHHFVATDSGGNVSFLAEGTLTILDD